MSSASIWDSSLRWHWPSEWMAEPVTLEGPLRGGSHVGAEMGGWRGGALRRLRPPSTSAPRLSGCCRLPSSLRGNLLMQPSSAH